MTSRMARRAPWRRGQRRRPVTRRRRSLGAVGHNRSTARSGVRHVNAASSDGGPTTRRGFLSGALGGQVRIRYGTVLPSGHVMWVAVAAGVPHRTGSHGRRRGARVAGYIRVHWAPVHVPRAGAVRAGEHSDPGQSPHEQMPIGCALIGETGSSDSAVADGPTNAAASPAPGKTDDRNAGPPFLVPRSTRTVGTSEGLVSGWRGARRGGRPSRAPPLQDDGKTNAI